MSEITIVDLPKLYENMDEATLGPWQVQLGSRLTAGDVLVELITDKTVVEFEAPCAGVLLKIYAAEKSTVPHGYALCAIGPEGAEAPDLSARNDACLAAQRAAAAGGIDLSVIGLAPKASVPVPEAPAAPSFRAAPAAKIFARQQGVELSAVAAFTGRAMIHRKDVEDYLASRPSASAAPAEPVASVPAPEAVAWPAESGGSGGGRVALVTGGTGGLGSAIVRRLARDGVSVAVHYHSDGPGAEALCASVSSEFGVSCRAFQADLAGDAGACGALADAVTASFGRLDILVNNAGCLSDAPLSFMSDEQWDDVMSLCLTVPFRMLRACSMGMARRGWGRVVNISSDAGRMGSANRSNYASAKEGLCGLTRSAALELAGRGVRVNAVSPGFIETRMTAGIPERRRQELLKTIPARRFARPEEVAELVGFLCSEHADYITGQVISINGGLCM